MNRYYPCDINEYLTTCCQEDKCICIICESCEENFGNNEEKICIYCNKCQCCCDC